MSARPALLRRAKLEHAQQSRQEAEHTHRSSRSRSNGAVDGRTRSDSPRAEAAVAEERSQGAESEPCRCHSAHIRRCVVVVLVAGRSHGERFSRRVASFQRVPCVNEA